MGWFGNIASKVRAWIDKDPTHTARALARGATNDRFPTQQRDLMGLNPQGMLGDWLTVDRDLISRFRDYEDMDEYGMIACLSGNSRVGILGKGRHGIEYVPIADLLERRKLYPEIPMHTLSLDVPNNTIVPVEFKGPVLSGVQQPVFKVTFQQYRAYKGCEKKTFSIRATANHPFMLRDGSYKTVANLAVGDRLMPVMLRTTSNGYPQVGDLFRIKKGKTWWHNLHRLVVQALLPDPASSKDVVHHVDGDKGNCVPGNLEFVSRAQHTKDHAITKRPEVRAKISAFSKKRWADPEKALAWSVSQRKRGAPSVLESNNPKPLGILSDSHRAAIAAGHTIPLAPDVVENALRTSTSISQAARKLSVSWNTLERRRVQYGLDVSILGSSMQTISEGCDSYENHFVLSVEPDGFDDVYDIEVPIYKNFIAEGVFVHNTAIDIFADDATQTDTVTNRTIWVTSPDKRIQEILDDELLQKRLVIDEEIWEIARTLCVARGSRIWGVSSTEVQDVKPKDRVLGLVGSGFDLLPVEAVHDNGEREVWRVRTKHRELVATPDHKVLIQLPDGSRYWKEIQDLVVRRFPSGGKDYSRTSELVICTRMGEGKALAWKDLLDLETLRGEFGSKGSPVQLTLPDEVDSDFCRLFGFLLGDGFFSSDKGGSGNSTVCYSRGVREARNLEYDDLLRSLGLRVTINRDQGRSEVHSVQLKRLLKALGWKQGSGNKRVPGWVYSLPESHRESFLWGFMDADGWSSRPSTWRIRAWHFEVSNHDLARDMKTLIDGLGFRSGNLRSRKRKPGFRIKGKVVKSTNRSWMLTFSTVRFDEKFVAEAIVGIEKWGVAPVHDLTVNHEVHNFITDGIVVHNCKYGNDFEEILLGSDGVVGFNFLPPATIRRVEDAKGNLLGFLQDFKERFHMTPLDFLNLLKKQSRGGAAKESMDPNDPNFAMAALEEWEVVHFRLRSKFRRSVYGFSVLEPARWIWKRLTILEDSAILFRLTKAVERLAFYVDVGDMPPAEAIAYVNRVRQQYRKKKYVNPTTGKLELRFDALSPDEDFFVPSRGGQDGTRIDVVGSPQWQCLVGETQIPLLDGSSPTIEELADRGGSFWVYSLDSGGNVVPGKARSARKTYDAAEIWEVVLDNEEIVRCTGNHPFLSRDGKWVLAGHLRPGDSLMPLYRKESFHKVGDRIDGYEKVYDPATEGWVYTHHISFLLKEANLKEFLSSGNVIHHVNLQKRDNTPENLEGFTRSDHSRLHVSSAERGWQDPSRRRKHRRMMIERMSDKVLRAEKGRILAEWNRSEDHKNRIRGSKHPRWNNTTLIDLEYLVLATGARGIHELMRKGKISQHVVHRILKSEGLTWNRFAEKNIPGWGPKGRALGLDNHKVVSVRNTGSFEPVYELTVEDHANFAVFQGVFVSNSMDDIEYFRDHMFSSIKVPKSYLAQEQGVARQVLSSEDVRFARTVLRVQREMKNGIRRVCNIHLMAKNIDPGTVAFQIWMTVPSAIFELAQLEVRNARADLASRMNDFVSLHWILKNVFGLPDEDIEVIIRERGEDTVRAAVAQGKGEAAAQKMIADALPQEGGPGGDMEPVTTQDEPEGKGIPAPKQDPKQDPKSKPKDAGEELASSMETMMERVREAAKTRGIRSIGISRDELRPSPLADKRASDKLEVILRSDKKMHRRLDGISKLLSDLAAAARTSHR